MQKTLTDYILSWQAYLLLAVGCLCITPIYIEGYNPLFHFLVAALMPGLALGVVLIFGSALTAFVFTGYSIGKELLSSKKGILALLIFALVVYLVSCPFYEAPDPYELQREMIDR